MGKKTKEQEKEKAMRGQKRKAHSSWRERLQWTKETAEQTTKERIYWRRRKSCSWKRKKKGMNSSDYLLSLLREKKIRIKKNSNMAKSNALLTLIPDKIHGKQTLKKLHQCQVEKEDRNQGK